MKAVAAGIAGGVAGAVLWGIIVAATGFEIGWIAWGIGALVGAGVAWGSAGGAAWGVVAVIISVLSILGGKVVAMEIVLDKEVKSVSADVSSRIDSDPEFVVSWLADAIVVKMDEQGKTINWPQDADPENPQGAGDYPPEVWSQAQSQWDAMDAQKKEEFKETIRRQANDNVKMMANSIKSEGFLASFGPMDIVFFLLAIATAYKIGSKTDTPS